MKYLRCYLLLLVGFFCMALVSNRTVSASSLPKAFHVTHVPRSAQGTWIQRYKGGAFIIKLTRGRYAYVTQEIGKRFQPSIQTTVTRTRHQAKNHFDLYSDFADTVLIKWSKHHVYNFGWESAKDWNKMTRISK